LALISQQLYGA